MFFVLDAMFAAIELVFFRHLQFFRSNEVEGRVEVAHSHEQGVYCTSVFQVTHQVDVQVFKCTLCLINRVEVQHGLRGVLVGTVTCIDDGHRSHFAGIACCTFQVVTHYDDVGIVAHHHDGIFQCLTLRRTGHLRISKPYYTCAKSVGRCFKTESGTGRWFKEKGSYYFTVEDFTVRILFEFFCHFQQIEDFFLGMSGN